MLLQVQCPFQFYTFRIQSYSRVKKLLIQYGRTKRNLLKYVKSQNKICIKVIYQITIQENYDKNIIMFYVSEYLGNNIQRLLVIN